MLYVTKFLLDGKLFDIKDQGRAVGFEKGGPDLVGDPPKKIITRPDPPKKSKSPQFWATSK